MIIIDYICHYCHCLCEEEMLVTFSLVLKRWDGLSYCLLTSKGQVLALRAAVRLLITSLWYWMGCLFIFYQVHHLSVRKYL